MDVLVAFYGSKLAIQCHIAEQRSRTTPNEFEDMIKRSADIPNTHFNVPNLIIDVTIPVRYMLDNIADKEGKVGLRISGKKQNLVGFFNPIPSCLPTETENPYLCIIYKKQLVSKNEAESCSEISESYFKENSKVEILV